MKKIATLLVILGTMTCHVMAQEINVESLLKKADDMPCDGTRNQR